ncbi:SDR family oxidoreductase [Stutzerimonas stutzeri]|uniref:SDR family oxidoreductase n=1 Tax=Stutzerimonas stutzeri TaxID=316 RepID=UPI00210F1071|nr:SDR family oxidoreductase [Stutzerimonas stutzeri]MCQ4257199.1 SDR family oxidoreductase [Stutzerimonas stutzeri]
MHISLKPLREQVVVITGASSGIGLATARMAVERGARVVLVARNEEALQDIKQQLNAGERVLHVQADVGDRQQLERVASETISHFGGFDTWINNAGSSVWGRFDEVNDEDHQQVMQTNFWGTHYGSSIAVKHLRDKGGALINIGSVESANALPFHSSYSASKHAIKAMTDVLRVELQKSRTPVSVTLVRPSSTDTQFMDHSKNYLPSAPVFPPPVYAPEVVARAILNAAEHPQRDVYIGNAKLLSKLAQNAPRLADWINRTFVYDAIQSGRPDRHPHGALHDSDVGAAGDGRASGNYPGMVLKRSLYTQATQHPLATTAAVAVGAAALVALLGRRGR